MKYIARCIRAVKDASKHWYEHPATVAVALVLAVLTGQWHW